MLTVLQTAVVQMMWESFSSNRQEDSKVSAQTFQEDTKVSAPTIQEDSSISAQTFQDSKVSAILSSDQQGYAFN